VRERLLEAESSPFYFLNRTKFIISLNAKGRKLSLLTVAVTAILIFYWFSVYVFTILDYTVIMKGAKVESVNSLPPEGREGNR
jgi:hypothetical protein